MKLELKHLAPYLPYGLECTINDKNKGVMTALVYKYNKVDLDFKYGQERCDIFRVKPILRPLSDLRKETGIEGNNITYLSYMLKETNLWVDYDVDIDVESLCYLEFEEYYSVVSFLFKHHFDVFGLIEKGLAVDINSIKN